MADEATDKAKAASRARGAGAPPVQAPNSAPANPLGIPLGTALGQGSRPVRPPGAIAADIAKLNEAIKQNSAQDAPPEESAQEQEPAEKKEEAEGEESAYNLFDGYSEHPNPILNPKYKERCLRDVVPLDVIELVTHGEMRQEVPILFNKSGEPILKVVFRTISGEEDLGVKSEMRSAEGGPTRYVLDRFSISQTCIGMHSIGGKEQIPCLDKDGGFDEIAFKKRFRLLLKWPQAIIEKLVQHYIWFCDRVSEAGVTEALGNG